MIVKICPSHGSLTRDLVSINKSGSRVYFRCVQCKRESYKKYYAVNHEKVRLDVAEYRKKDPEKWKKLKRESWLKHKDKHLAKRRIYSKQIYHKDKEHTRTTRNRQRKFQTTSLSRGYVTRNIRKTIGLELRDITDDVIAIYRAKIEIKRFIRRLKFKQEEMKNE